MRKDSGQSCSPAAGFHSDWHLSDQDSPYVQRPSFRISAIVAFEPVSVRLTDIDILSFLKGRSAPPPPPIASVFQLIVWCPRLCVYSVFCFVVDSGQLSDVCSVLQDAHPDVQLDNRHMMIRGKNVSASLACVNL